MKQLRLSLDGYNYFTVSSFKVYDGVLAVWLLQESVSMRVEDITYMFLWGRRTP